MIEAERSEQLHLCEKRSATQPRGKDPLEDKGFTALSSSGQLSDRVVTLMPLVLTLSVHGCELQICEYVKPVCSFAQIHNV